MNDDLPPVDPDEVEAPLDDRALAELQSRLRDVPPAQDGVRAAHLAAALMAFDDRDDGAGSAAAHDDADVVVPLAPRRSGTHRADRQRLMQRLAIAAGVLLIAGLGVFLAKSSTSSNDSADSVASSATESAANSATADASKSAGAGSDASAALPSNAAAPQAPPPGDADAGIAAADLGAFGDDAALATAIAGRPADVATRSQEDGAPLTTLAAPVMGAAVPRCPAVVGGDSRIVYAATVAGRPVWIIATTGSSQLQIVDQADCSTRPL